MAKEKQAAVEAEKTGAENVNTEAVDASIETITQEELDNVEVPEDAEEISQ